MATQNNKRILHRKEWQQMTPAQTASAAGSFIVKDPMGVRRTALYVASSTVQFIYAVDEDAWMQIPSMAIAGTFGAGACGCWIPWSNTLTTNGGSTTSLTTSTATNSRSTGSTIRFLTGANAGLEAACTGTKVVPGGNTTMYFSALPNVVSSGDTFAVSTGRYLVMGAGTVAAGIFKSYDVLTGVVTSLGTTGLPGTLGTDCKLVSTPSYVGAFAQGTATSATSTTLVNSAKTWTVNQWSNYQVRITSGTGRGQVRSITSNTSTALTVPAWTITPDATSVYAIEGNDDYVYLAGNAAVTMYRYSISAASWATLAPTTARSAAPNVGMSLNWVAKSGDATWADESAILDGRYIYSFRGNGSAVCDRYDIAGGTAGAGAWYQLSYINQQEVFSTGSAYDYDTGKIYIRQSAAHRYFYLDIPGNMLYPLTTNTYTDGAALVGDKLFTVSYTAGAGSDSITWLYSLMNTGTALHRIMLF